MSLASMTGYGQSEIRGPDFRITFEVKTFNSRFLDVSVHLPKELAHLEMLVRDVVRKRVWRGRVDVFVNLETIEKAIYQVNREAVASYQMLAESLKKDFNIDGELSFATLLQLPGVVDVRSPAFLDDRGALQEKIHAGLTKSLQAVTQMRLQEGRQLAAELLGRIGRAEVLLQEVSSLVEPAKEAYRQRLSQRLREYRDRAEMDDDRIGQEVLIFAERGDITEEIIRLRSHFEQFRILVEQGGEAGKKLDFLLQEMNRETNTILSKSLHRKISEAGVLLKAEVEKLREQVQNIE